MYQKISRCTKYQPSPLKKQIQTTKSPTERSRLRNGKIRSRRPKSIRHYPNERYKLYK